MKFISPALLIIPAAIPALLFSPLAPQAASAQNVLTWTGGSSGTWNNSGGGWSGGFPPVAQTSVNLDGNTAQNTTVSLAVYSEIMNLFIDQGDILRITGANRLNIKGAPPALIADQLV